MLVETRSISTCEHKITSHLRVDVILGSKIFLKSVDNGSLVYLHRSISMDSFELVNCFVVLIFPFDLFAGLSVDSLSR